MRRERMESTGLAVSVPFSRFMHERTHGHEAIRQYTRVVQMTQSTRRFRGWATCAVLLMLGVVAGCGSSGDDGVAAPGAVSVSLTDAPACGFDAVNVTVSKVRIHQSDSASENAAGWTEIALNPPRKINLLNLNDPTQPNFALEHLGESPLPAGHYTQVRLVLVPNGGGSSLANSVVPSGTTNEIALDTPSAVQSGIKLIHQFNVGSGQRVDLLLDFDACHSIVQTGSGKYKLKPVIKVIPFVLNGIEGFVDTTVLGDNVVVSAQSGGNIVRVTRPNTAGKFFLARLDAPAQYTVVFTADSHVTKAITGVPVPSSNMITVVSTNVAPITLGASATHIIGGTVLLTPPTDDETVFVAAKQSLSGGPTVTIKSLPAPLVDGPPPGDSSYSLTLPTAAPLLGPYSALLPITFTAHPTVAGQYAVQAAAAGYSTQSFDKDISTADQTQNFALVP
jgi:hypothetical protein